jgi:hypothetical protein
MAWPQLWRHIPGKTLLVIVNVMAATALIFEGKPPLGKSNV